MLNDVQDIIDAGYTLFFWCTSDGDNGGEKSFFYFENIVMGCK